METRTANLGDRVRSLALPADNRGRGGSWSWFPWLLSASLAASTAYFASLAFGPKSEIETPVAAAPTTPALQLAEQRTMAEGEIALRSKGYVIAAHQILISPEVSGRLLRLHVEEGRRVAKGDVLAEVEATQYDADFKRGQATLELARHRLEELEKGNRPQEIAAAEAELAESLERLPQLKALYERNRTLFEKQPPVVTPTDFESSESEYRSLLRKIERLRQSYAMMREGPRVEKINAARAEVKQAEADLVKAKWRLDNCRILAPISGTILKKNAEEGNIVNPGAFNGSFSLCEMADLSDLEVDLNIQERDVAQVFVGQKCRVQADAFRDRTYDGVVSRLMPIADRAKGAIPIRVKLRVPSEEEGVYLKPEMGAEVTFLAGKTPSAP